MAQKRVFAFLVGINDYRLPVPKLTGCVPDMEAVEAYLRTLPEVELHLRTLKNEEATKARLVDTWLQHLGQAGPEDVIFFYFSGHGTREAAHEVFWPGEPSHSLQSLVTYDGVWNENGLTRYHLLADKELRYLIHEVAATGAHILTIFDCCHSGQNTRSAQTIRARRFEDRNIGAVLPQRKWEEFIFGNTISPEQLKFSNLATLLPEGRHVQIAACLPDESAFERENHGVFTQNLLEVLQRSDSRITYNDLQSRIRQYIKNNFKQTPQIYVAEGAQDEVFRFFLDRTAPQGAPLYGNVYFKEGEGWQIDLGQIHGISPGSEQLKIESLAGKLLGMANITAVKATESQFVPLVALSPVELYRGYFAGAFSAPMSVFFNTEHAAPGALKLIEQRWGEGGRSLRRAESESTADYTLHFQPQAFVITRANDPTRPVVATINEINAEGATKVVFCLGHISQWEFTKNLHNPNSWLFKTHPIQIEIWQVGNDGKESLLPLINEEVHPGYTRLSEGRPSGSVKIKLTNTFTEKLFVSLFYLSMNFEVITELIPQGVVALESKQSLWILEGRSIPLTYEPEVEILRYPASLTYLKIIASTVFFDTNRFKLSDLPSPVVRGAKVAITKAGRTMTASGDDWITRLITLKIPNPNL